MTGERILIVEDERAVARGLEYSLQADGFRQPVLMLSARDEEVDKVLGLELAAHADRPVSRAALIESIWGYDSDSDSGGDIGGERTVDVHIRHLRIKIETDPANPAHILTVRGIGYKFQG